VKNNIRDNTYDLRNYRADNGKLRVYLPGEMNNELAKKKEWIKEKIENRRLDKWLDNYKN
jgi:hypothetical protein